VSLSDEQRRDATKIGWYARFIDARFDVDETERWEKMVRDGLSRDTATAVVLAGRRALDEGQA
jgi:hypothetical protein